VILCTYDFPVCLISLSKLPKSNKCLNFGTQNLRPSNDTVIFQRPSCGANIAVASGFIAGTAPVVRTHVPLPSSSIIWYWRKLGHKRAHRAMH